MESVRFGKATVEGSHLISQDSSHELACELFTETNDIVFRPKRNFVDDLNESAQNDILHKTAHTLAA